MNLNLDSAPVPEAATISHMGYGQSGTVKNRYSQSNLLTLKQKKIFIFPRRDT